jgi:PAS domain S-box-containing protein
MPNHSDSALRLLIVDDSVEDAEAIVSALRNDGIAVRPLRPSDADELAVMLAEQQVDLVLAAQGASSIPLGEVMRTVASSDKDIPIVGLVDDVDPELAAQVYAAGARRLGLRGEPAQLLRSIRLEWNDLETRRSLRRLDAQVRETERRCDALIESSRDPIAYVHEGMHIRANPAYLEMFGFDSFEDVEGMSLLDLVAAQHVEGFKRLLKSLSRGEPPPPRYELEARGANGETFPATMEFTQAMYEGEPCLQVVFRRQEFDRAKSRSYASATRSPACSIGPPSCARWRTRWPTPARNAARTACCWSSPTTTSACCTRSAWTRPTRSRSRWHGGCSRRWRVSPMRSPRASASTPLPCSCAAPTTSPPTRWPSACVRPSTA